MGDVPGGVVLRQSVPKSLLIRSPDKLGEFAVLRVGPIEGATPIILSKHIKKMEKKYPKGERSFRQTIHGQSRSDRGFMVVIDRKERKILISFDAQSVDIRHKEWFESVKQRIGLGELNPQPYWGFDDLEHKAGTKLLNTFYVQAEVKTERKKEYYH